MNIFLWLPSLGLGEAVLWFVFSQAVGRLFQGLKNKGMPKSKKNALLCLAVIILVCLVIRRLYIHE